MVKTAIFVEGQTELIFVREFLLKYFEYQNISLDCFALIAEGNMEVAPYAFPNPEAPYYFQIINAGGDNSVLSNLLKREKHLLESGFHRIIGLRDMFSEAYLKMAPERKIVPDITARFIAGHQGRIDTVASQPENIFFRFAIMETEAWLLALPQVFEAFDDRLTSTFIQQNLGYNLLALDPEKEFFHPANDVEKILALVARIYGKHEKDSEKLVGNLEKTDYNNLLESGKCSSFRHFFETIPMQTVTEA